MLWILVLFAGVFLVWWGLNPDRNSIAAEAAPEPSEQTIITPHLDQAISGGQNVLWCSTLQLAWNELATLAEGPIQMENETPLVSQLNEQTATKADLDEASYVVTAGIVGQEELSGLPQELLQEMEALPKGSLIAYAYLSKILPFEWAFTRYTQPFSYGGQEVASFGIPQYMPDDPNDAKLGKQLVILDYADADDFIVELKTRSGIDRLILAKVSPGATLQATVNTVVERVSGAQPSGLQELESLVIPVLDFDLTRAYPELCGRKIIAANQEVNGKQFSLVTQRIRFKLDETGAALESKAVFVSAPPPREFVFDKPFLLLLLQQDAEAPYLAVWVENAALLVPFVSH